MQGRFLTGHVHHLARWAGLQCKHSSVLADHPKTFCQFMSSWRGVNTGSAPAWLLAQGEGAATLHNSLSMKKPALSPESGQQTFIFFLLHPSSQKQGMGMGHARKSSAWGKQCGVGAHGSGGLHVKIQTPSSCSVVQHTKGAGGFASVFEFGVGRRISYCPGFLDGGCEWRAKCVFGCMSIGAISPCVRGGLRGSFAMSAALSAKMQEER